MLTIMKKREHEENPMMLFMKLLTMSPNLHSKGCGS